MTEYFWCMTAYLLEEFFMLGGTASAICVFFSSRESRKKYILFSSASLLIIIVTYSLYKLGATIEHVNMGWMTWGEYFLAVTIFAYFVVSASVALSVILNIITGGIGSIFFFFFVLLPSLGLSIRRLHDINLRGWWFLINAIPVVGLAIFIVFVCLKGTKGANRFGSEPGAENIEAEVVA